MDFSETPAQVALRAAVAAVAERFGIDYYVAQAEARDFPTLLWDELAAQGHLGVAIDGAYGGGGAGLSELALVCEETAAAGCPLLLLIVSTAIGAEVIGQHGTAQQRARWLPGLAAGTSRMVFALTEPEAGSNAHRLATIASREGDGYRLRGRKHLVSGLDVAETVLVVARNEDGSGLSLFVVDADDPGLVAEQMPMAVALPERQYAVTLDVRVAADRLVGAEGEGFRQIFAGLNPERVAGAALLVGMGRYALRTAAAYASSRVVWDRPIGAHQAVAFPLAEARIAIEGAALLTARAASLHDLRDPRAGEAANMAKHAAAEAAAAALDAALQCHGGIGVGTGTGLIQLAGLARILRLAPVSREMILGFVAQHSLGLPRSY